MLERVWRKGWEWYSHYGEQCGDSLKKLGIELPYDPAIRLMGIPTEQTRIERDTCTPMFIAALFTIARTWKQPRCPSADKWIRKLWYIYTIEYYSAIINKHIWISSNEVDETGAYYTEWSQKQKHQCSILMHIYGIYKDGNDDPICKTAKETQI